MFFWQIFWTKILFVADKNEHNNICGNFCVQKSKTEIFLCDGCKMQIAFSELPPSPLKNVDGGGVGRNEFWRKYPPLPIDEPLY